MTDRLAARVAAALVRPLPEIGGHRRLWLVGTGPFHDAAELGTFTFAGSGHSAAAVAGEGHARLGELLGPQDACVLLGGDPDLTAYANRVAAGAGATVVTLAADIADEDDPTTTFAVAGTLVLMLCRSLAAPGVSDQDLAGLAAAVGEAETSVSDVSPAAVGSRVLVIGSGPAAVSARHLAVVLRASNPAVDVEGLDAQDVPGAAARHLGPGTTVLALDPERDPEAPVARIAKMATTEGANVIGVAAPQILGPVASQIPLAIATARALWP